LYEFGYGLSYTSFEYSNLKINPKVTGSEGDICISLDVTNTGNRTGAEVVQLYIKDVISSVNTPVKNLQGFDKILLDPGEKKGVEFILKPMQLSFIDQNLKWVVEPGTFAVMIGSSSEKIQLKGEFEIK
jgi:beta-glucosidase